MDRSIRIQAMLVASTSLFAITALTLWIASKAPLSSILIAGTTVGLIGGPLLIGLMSIAQKNALKKILGPDQAGKRTLDGEPILHYSNATHFYRKEGVGGVLLLTNSRLVFQSHRMNIQNHRWEIQLQNIEAFDRRKTLGIIPNGLKIVAAGKEDRFVVMNASLWKERLHLAITSV